MAARERYRPLLTTWSPIVISVLLAGRCLSGQAGPPHPVQGGTPPGNSRIFAAVFLFRGSVAGSNRGSYGAFVRDGSDTTWTKLNRSNVICFGLGHAPHGPRGTLYIAGGNGLHRSTDGGGSWKILTGWRTEEIMGVVTDPDDPARLTVATPFGVFQSADAGGTWKGMNAGLKRWYIHRLFADVRERKVLFALAEDDLYRSAGSGSEWIPMSTGVRMPVAFAQEPAGGQVMLLGSDEQGVRRSTDGGRTWSPVEVFGEASLYAIRFSPDGTVVYAGGYGTGLWRSADQGLRWERLPFPEEHEAINAIFIDPLKPEVLMVGTHGQGVYESTDRGATWKFAGLRGGIIKQIERYP